MKDLTVEDINKITEAINSMKILVANAIININKATEELARQYSIAIKNALSKIHL